MKFLRHLVLVLCVSTAHAGSYDDFFRAVVGDNPRAIEALVARGFDPNSVDPQGQPAIIRALQAESYQAALALARLPATRVDLRNPAGETPLMMAALKNEMDVFEALLARGAAIDGPGWTPLHYAAAGDSLRAVQELLRRGARVDARAPNNDRTPLMMAVLTASEPVVNALLAAGADPAARDRHGRSVAELAAAGGRDWLARRLEGLAAKARGAAPAREGAPSP
jgi:hypothetical protein